MVKWSAETDQTLFYLVLSQEAVKPDYHKIAAIWPDNKGDKPTARAISERIVKIKKMVVDAGNAPGKSSRAANGTKGTPTKVSKTQSTPKSSAKKRKMQQESFDSDDDEEDNGSPPKKQELDLADSPSPTKGRGNGNGLVGNAARGLEHLSVEREGAQKVQRPIRTSRSATVVVKPEPGASSDEEGGVDVPSYDSEESEWHGDEV